MEPPKDSRFLMTTGIMLSPPLALAFEISGALIIQQLHYWLATSKHQHSGYTWIYNTYDKWVDHLKVYSDKTIRNKIKELEDLGVIITGNFNKTQYDRTRWYRLDYETLLKVASERLPNWKLLPLASGNHFQIIPVAATGPIPKNTQEKTQEKFSVKPSLHGKITIKVKAPATDIELKDSLMPKTIAPAKELLAQLKTNRAAPAMAPNSGKSLAHIWRTGVGKHHPTGGMVPVFTMAQLGQFSQIARKLSKDSDKVVEHCIVEWVGFTKYVANAVGLHKTPDLPNIGFMLKYAGEGSAFHAQSKAAVQLIAPKKPKVQFTPVKSKAPKQADHPAEKKDVASLQDVLDWKPGKD